MTTSLPERVLSKLEERWQALATEEVEQVKKTSRRGGKTAAEKLRKVFDEMKEAIFTPVRETVKKNPAIQIRKTEGTPDTEEQEDEEILELQRKVEEAEQQFADLRERVARCRQTIPTELTHAMQEQLENIGRAIEDATRTRGHEAEQEKEQPRAKQTPRRGASERSATSEREQQLFGNLRLCYQETAERLTEFERVKDTLAQLEQIWKAAAEESKKPVSKTERAIRGESDEATARSRRATTRKKVAEALRKSVAPY